MYSPNDTTKPISARMAPGLTERIDFECQRANLAVNTAWGARKWNRNYFLNCAAELLLLMRREYACGNLDLANLPKPIRGYSWMLE